ncbi:hypothetical protein EBI00_02435 [Marinomonas hwangdonensis]|uniref:Uncharacterized protein n=1 Tax=Marinomonas hwangdonensis TaxID=1053647 RepID=A0A3M8QA96_9GAMM|nr:hypothetical protein [Marinomonas hwangdonensis]RNF52977.1 hypothetical protein EBI00_02435 [Marinomonas hwangdonensis]
MQYLSARQMWHDAFYSRSANDQLLEINRSNANLLRRKQVMNETQTRGPADNSSRVMHMAKAGRVQSEIAKLPEHLQAFGMYCWAPKEQDSLPTYKHHNEIANALAQEVKEKFPREYAYYTSRVSIVVLNVLKYEFERDKGRKPQNIDITLAGAMAMPKDKVRAQWGHIVKHIRGCIRDMQLATDSDKNLSIGILHLLKVWQTKTGAEATEKHSVIASLALKSFAHTDQSYLFSASEEREPVTHTKPLYTQEYLSWRVGVAQSNWKRDGWQDVFEQMTGVLNEWAESALATILNVKGLPT